MPDCPPLNTSIAVPGSPPASFREALTIPESAYRTAVAIQNRGRMKSVEVVFALQTHDARSAHYQAVCPRCHTGDIAVMDEAGYFRIVDRIKDMINVSGMKVYTTEVDEVLFRHPAVSMAAAFGVPDADAPGSERVMAVIRLKDAQAGQVTEEQIREYCRAHLPPYAVPKHVEFRNDLPLTVTEKVFKRALREEAIARMNAGAKAG